MLQKISYRLGMEGGLYIGICLGGAVAAILISCTLFLVPDVLTASIVSIALIISSVLGAVLVVILKRIRKDEGRQFCTCRYRSSLYTYCRECALNDKDQGDRSGPDNEKKTDV